MKIIVSMSGSDLDSPVDPRFGRSAGFLLFDTETGEYRVVDNSRNLNTEQGAGIQAAEVVSRLGGECLLTGHCGPKAFRALQVDGIRVYTGVAGTVRSAIEAFRTGLLTETRSSDVESHWV